MNSIQLRLRKLVSENSVGQILSVCLIVGSGLFASGCTVQEAPPPLPAEQEMPPQGDLEHVVKYSGETLGLIADWYTGKVTNWSAIAKYNGNLKPERIHIGQVIRIPRNMVVKDSPLPREEVSRALARGRKAAEENALQQGTMMPGDPGAVQTGTAADLQIPSTAGVPGMGTESTGQIPAPPSAGGVAVPAENLPSAGVAVDNAAAGMPPLPAGGMPSGEIPAPKAVEPDSVPSAGAGAPQMPSDDAERERLLDELLSQ